MTLGEPIASARLVGYAAADRGRPGFVRPVFRSDRSNRALLQTVAADGSVSGFEETAADGLVDHRDEGRAPLGVRDPALWGFRLPDGAVVIETRGAMAERLARALPSIEDPLLRLPIAEFISPEEGTASALGEAFEHLRGIARASALAWRDLVVVPAGVRGAVRHAMREIGQPVDEAAERVGIRARVQDDRILVELDDGSFGALLGDRRGLKVLRDRTAPLREAFSLGGRVGISRRSTREDRPRDERREAGGAMLVGLGRNASTLLLRHFAEPSSPADLGFVDHMRPSRPSRDVPFAIVHGGRALAAGDATRIEDLETLIRETPAPVPIVVVFEFDAGRPAASHEAAQLAGALAGREAVVAVIAGLPRHHPPASSRDFQDLAAMVTSTFRRTFLLSEVSPYMRYRTPFGPARSASALAERLRMLLAVAGRADAPPFLRLDDRIEPRLSTVVAVASATDTSASEDRLADQALERLLDPFLETYGGRTVHLERAAAPARSLVAAWSGRPAAPGGDRPAPSTIGATRTVTAFVDGAGLRPCDGEIFPRLCRAELKLRGWAMARHQLRKNALEATIGDERHVLEFAFGDRMRAWEAVLERQPGERIRHAPSIILTDQPVRQSTFVRAVLVGTTPVHFSRIPSVIAIHRKRFVHAVRYLANRRTGREAILLPAATLALRADAARIAKSEDLPPDVASVLRSHVVVQDGDVTSLLFHREGLVLKANITLRRPDEPASAVRSAFEFQLGVDGWTVLPIEWR